MLGLTDKRTKHLYKNLLRIQRFLVTLFSNNYKLINTSNVNEQPPIRHSQLPSGVSWLSSVMIASI
jgi:hypothetical protein